MIPSYFLNTLWFLSASHVLFWNGFLIGFYWVLSSFTAYTSVKFVMIISLFINRGYYQVLVPKFKSILQVLPNFTGFYWTARQWTIPRASHISMICLWFRFPLTVCTIKTGLTELATGKSLTLREMYPIFTEFGSAGRKSRRRGRHGTLDRHPVWKFEGLPAAAADPTPAKRVSIRLSVPRISNR